MSKDIDYDKILGLIRLGMLVIVCCVFIPFYLTGLLFYQLLPKEDS